MKKVTFVSILIVLAVVGVALSQPGRDTVGRRPDVAVLPRDECLPRPQILEIRAADPVVNMAHHNLMRDKFIEKAKQPNTTILLGPNVVLNFSKINLLPIEIARCVTIRSVARFEGPSVSDVAVDRDGLAVVREGPRSESPAGATATGRVTGVTGVLSDNRPDTVVNEPRPQTIPEARSSTSLGPVLKFGPHRSDGDKVFLQARCFPALTDQADHIRISGFRIHGPSFGQQDVGDTGILIDKCVDVEISNMEIAGFGGQAILVRDDLNEYFNPPIPGEAWELRGMDGICREPPFNGPEGRIGRPDQVRIIGNYIHSNQKPRGIFSGSAGGYGVEVNAGAHALIAQNVFSTNRHSIMGAGTMGGYDATQNLVLRYGGVHFNTVITFRTHAFDIHGTGDNGFSGWAGARTKYSFNAFQFSVDNAIKVRGSPRCGIEINNNVFPHPGLEDDDGADAVALEYRQDIGAIQLGPNNRLNTQTYGRYGVCDFDGDAIDDLFLATGVSWWFSGMGEFPWRFLALRNEDLGQLRFGYFDADNKCDVLTERDNAWMISSGGTGQWHRWGQEFAPLSQVAFGRFDLSQRDQRPGVTRTTTHAFWSTPSGQWKITTLSGTGQGWRVAGSSGFPMNELRFGDFNGDGVTDVLARENGRWAISSGAAGSWSRINSTLGDAVRGLYIADINHNNKDDLIRLKYFTLPISATHVREFYEWEISFDGATRWMPLKKYAWTISRADLLAPHTFAGRFGNAPGAGILTIDRAGKGQFHAPGESRVGAAPDWTSTFRY